MFLINCDNKGCHKASQAVIDLSDNQVYCVECGNTIKNITPFAKNQLKNLGQTKKPKKEGFQVKCEKCKKEGMPKLSSSNELICFDCNNVLNNVPKPFELVIKQAIQNNKKEL